MYTFKLLRKTGTWKVSTNDIGMSGLPTGILNVIGSVEERVPGKEFLDK